MSKIDWRDRESERFKSGAYRALPWASEAWWIECEEIHADHYAHLSVERDSKIAFTVDAAKGEADRQTRMKPGRYLNRYFDGVLSPDKIRDLASTVDLAEGTVAYKLATTPEEIEQVYREGPRSCMSGESAESTRVYGAGDLAVAYIEPNGNTGLTGEREISCRVLVWPAKKIYSRPYGDETRLIPLLREDGYASAGRMGFAGAKILRIERDNGGFVGPYFDGNEHAEESECGEYFVLGASGYPMGSTSGVIGGTACSYCEEICDEDSSVYALDQTWCEDCASERLFYCESCDEYASTDELIVVGDRYFCQYCAEQNCFCCSGCNEWQSDEDGVRVDDEPLCQSCFEDSDACECEECGDLSTSCVTVHQKGEESYACESCAASSFTECDACGERRHDRDDWTQEGEACDECEGEALSSGAQEILDASNESFEEIGTLVLPARAASLAC